MVRLGRRETQAATTELRPFQVEACKKFARGLISRSLCGIERFHRVSSEHDSCLGEEKGSGGGRDRYREGRVSKLPDSRRKVREHDLSDGNEAETVLNLIFEMRIRLEGEDLREEGGRRVSGSSILRPFLLR